MHVFLIEHKNVSHAELGSASHKIAELIIPKASLWENSTVKIKERR